MRPLTQKWLAQSRYDLKTAGSMLRARRYLYVAFMCQQALEKMLKGIIHELSGNTPPYSHRLVALLELAKLTAPKERLDFLDLLTRYYINARYPEQKQKLAKGLKRPNAKQLLHEAEETIRWLKRESRI